MQETQVRSLGWEDPLEEGIATDSSIFARRIPWTEEPGRLQIMGSKKFRHDCNRCLLSMVLSSEACLIPSLSD